MNAHNSRVVKERAGSLLRVIRDAASADPDAGELWHRIETEFHANQREVSNEKTPGARFVAIDKMTMLQGQKHNVDSEKLQACIKAQDEGAVKASMKEAEGIGVSATPTMFINGQKIDGAVPIGEVRAALDRALKDAGQPAPTHVPDAPSASK